MRLADRCQLPGNQELSLVRDKVVRPKNEQLQQYTQLNQLVHHFILQYNDGSWKDGGPPGELGVSKSTECDIFTFSALTLLVG